MLPFLHGRRQQLAQVLERSNEVFGKFSRMDLDLAPALAAHLDEAVALYRARGDSKAENELLALKAQLVATEQGINPLTSERIAGHRRQLIRAIALRVLQQSALVLRADAETIDGQLADAGRQLRPIALLGIQKGLIVLDPAPKDQDELDAVWKALASEPEIALAARQLAMQVGPFDLLLLLGELIAAAAASGQGAPGAGPSPGAAPGEP